MKSILISFSVLFYIIAAPITGLSQQAASTPKSKISGKVVDQATSDALVGATVLLEGTTQGCLTDIEGRYHLHVAPGSYTVVVNYMSYKSFKVAVDIATNEVKVVDIAMEEAVSTTDAVEITYTVQQSSALAIMMERKNAASVSDGVSAELIRRTPDRTTADVLKRVTGASIQEGKFAIIRGMNDRYNAGYLDGALMPSTESDRKAFAFDAVPANLIDNLQIIKTGSPEMAGDFGGGIIRINTKAVPAAFTQTVSLGAQYNSITTFQDYTQFKKYSGEVFGLYNSDRAIDVPDDNSFKLVNAFPTTQDKARLAAGSVAFNHDWSSEVINALPNTRFSYSLGVPIKVFKDRKLGVIFALNYANTRRFSYNEINAYDGSGQTTGFKDSTYQQNITAGGLFNVNYVGKNLEVNFRNLLNANSDDNTVLRGGSGNLGDGILTLSKANVFTYNRLYNSILSAKHIVGKNFMTINGSVNYANIHRRMPDYRIVSYFTGPDLQTETGYIYRYQFNDNFRTSTGRFTSDLKEYVMGANLDFSKQIDFEEIKTNIKIGGMYQQRNREFTSRSFVYANTDPEATVTTDPAIDLAADKIGANGLYLIEKSSDDVSYYEGAQTLAASYISVDQRFHEKLRAVYGVRYENVNIRISSARAKLDSIAFIQQAVWLPSANLTYSLTSKMNLRAAYYASVNRPEFRELAPFSFYTFDKNAEIKGNKDLQVARLNNVDVRWELFPSGSQVISVGGFYKSILNPIEFSLDITQPFTTFTFENEKSANIYGVELEFRKDFSFLGQAQFFKDLTVYANLSLIKSKLQFEEGSKASANRSLQGQSPYIINSGMQYDNSESGWSGSVTVNRTGRRIAFVGVDPQWGATRQDIYENPRTVLDAQVGKSFGKFNLKFTLGDLFHQDLVFYQDEDLNKKFSKETGATDRVMFRYTNGMTMTLGASYSF